MFALKMSQLGTSRKRPMADTVKNFIVDTPDLIFDGAKIQFLVCKISLMCWSRGHCQCHIESKQHSSAKSGIRDQEKFTFDLCITLILCNLSFRLLDKEAFVSFCDKYADCKLPSRTSIRNVVPFTREHIKKRIKTELKDKKLWLCVDETTDRQKHSVINIMVRTMEPHRPSSFFLLASKRVINCTADEILKVVLNSLSKFEVSTKQLLMFMSDGAANMRSLGRSLKEHSGNFLHVTCKIYTLNLAAKTIPTCFPLVNALIAGTKAVFLKSPKRIRLFHKLCPDLLEPPQPIVTRWETWMQAALDYNKYFDLVNTSVIRKFESVLEKDFDFLILRQICEGACEDALSCFKDYFKYANITSLDIERSFSALKNIYSARRTRLTETAAETYLMIQIFNRCYPVCDFTEDF